MNPSPPGADDLDRILDFPWEVLEYLSWLRQRPSNRTVIGGYLFDVPAVRFAVAETDLVVAERDISVSVGAGELELSAPRASRAVTLEAIGLTERRTVEEILRRLDGQSSLAIVRASLDSGATRILDALLDAAFGKLLFAPLAVMSLERALSGVEIARFPGSPYELERPYWKNMAAVRATSEALFARLDDDDAFVRELRRLHVILLLGEDLQSYYQPASPISSGRAAPGRIMLTPSELLDTPDGALFISGPRVSAPRLGGDSHSELLYRSLGEPAAVTSRRFQSEAGLDWGRLVMARAPADAAAAPWYCPPRPVRREHWLSLRTSLAAAERAARAADRASSIEALATFHQNFVRLHPFHCGNQSLAMNLVNRVLCDLLSAGMPHLMLDHLAFRLSPVAYARVFRRAVDVYVQPSPNAAARFRELASNRTRACDLARQLDAAHTVDEAEALARANMASARLLLLTDD